MSVALTDGRSVSLQLDSASTSAEVCQAVADRVNLRDTFGFSLYITFQDKVRPYLRTLASVASVPAPVGHSEGCSPVFRFQMSSLGSCSRHVLDEVSLCEQEKDAPWRLSVRKEVFTPWHDSSVDPISTDLIYKQVITGIKSGGYTCDMVRSDFWKPLSSVSKLVARYHQNTRNFPTILIITTDQCYEYCYGLFIQTFVLTII